MIRYQATRNTASLKSMIREIISDMERLAKSKGVNIAFNNHATCNMSSVDVALMPGAFRNLLLNAIEHVADLATAADKIITIEMYNRDDKIVTTINNRGEPISPDRLESFFEKFNFSSSRKKNSLGLGTNYAYLVVKSHQGNIHVRSNAEEGTTVTVALNIRQNTTESIQHIS